jgi:hypothetical protein
MLLKCWWNLINLLPAAFDLDLLWSYCWSSKIRKYEVGVYSQTQEERTARNRTFLFAVTGVRYNLVNLCTKMTNLA